MSPEERVDFMMMLCFSESFYEDERRFSGLRRILLANPDPQPTEAFARQIAASGRHDARNRVARLAMPVHVIGAGRDMLVPVWKSRELAELVPGSKLTIFERSGHAVNLEAADELNRAVLEFLAQTRTAAA
jgi:pimeloyl-ACP methyl ester carboxylesterase